MAVDVQHWLEVLFDGSGGAALIALLSAWSARKQERESTKAPRHHLRWMIVAALSFVIFLSVGVAIHIIRNGWTGTKPVVSSVPVPNPTHPTVAGGARQPKRVATTADEITALIATHLQVDRTDVKPDSDLVLDLGADPMDKVEILMAVETAYNMPIPDDDARKLKSVGDIIMYVQVHERAHRTSSAR